MLNDQNLRATALDPKGSFIVEAPAGSGKTTILIERFLQLLTTVTQPEEILAITFTRKATHEMVTRLYKRLQKTDDPLVQKILLRDQQYNWQLIKHPEKLRIYTIDALCSRIIAAASIKNQLLLNRRILASKEAQYYYTKAITTIWQQIDELKSNYRQAFATILNAFSNREPTVLKLLTELLMTRDKWLPHLIGLKHDPELKSHLENNLKIIVDENIAKIKAEFPLDLYQELYHLITEIAAFNQSAGYHKIFPLKLSAQISDLNFTTLKSLTSWLITKDHNWRQKLTTKEGLIPSSFKLNAADKKLARNLKIALENHLKHYANFPALKEQLNNFVLTPPAEYTTAEWKINLALLKILPLITASLQTIMAEAEVIDYTEISLNAFHLLKTEPNLLLKFATPLKHLLIDEFQDTSIAQFNLIETLISAWETTDEHSIFIVGDPLQSIYRFRNAEVGLFLRTKQQGIANFPLTSLTLSTNFRTKAELVMWCNQAFTQILPPVADIQLGAVPFTPATTLVPAVSAAGITIKLFKTTVRTIEADAIVNLTQKLLTLYPEENLAILVRARSHLTELLPKLKAAAIPFVATASEPTEIRKLLDYLFNLTSALCNLNDQTAWLALLRTPICGLPISIINTLYELSGDTWWEKLQHLNEISLENNHRNRLSSLITALEPIISLRYRLTWRELIITAWDRLTNGTLTPSATLRSYVAEFVALLPNSTAKPSLTLLKQQLDDLLTITEPSSSAARLMIMTIHQAKGLEFDRVILPGIDRTTKNNTRPLFLWKEQPGSKYGSNLILAPLIREQNAPNQIYNYLYEEEKTRDHFETTRLLYVALTRAKKELFLFGSATEVTTNQSFLGHLKPLITPEMFEETLATPSQTTPNIAQITYLPQVTTSHPLTTIKLTSIPNTTETESQKLGTTIHQLLSQIHVIDDFKHYSDTDFGYYLRINHCLPTAEHIALIKKALTTMLSDPRGQWILAPHHSSAYELPITRRTKNGTLEHYRIDRTFIDETTNIRWIIDYKITAPYPNESLDAFCKREVDLYRQQLTNYATLLKLQDPEHPVKIALYYPLLPYFLEVLP